MRERETPEIKVAPLTDCERFEIVTRIPSISAKSLDGKQIQLLLDNQATTNPLYLIVALEELRGFGRALPHLGAIPDSVTVGVGIGPPGPHDELTLVVKAVPIGVQGRGREQEDGR